MHKTLKEQGIRLIKGCVTIIKKECARTVELDWHPHNLKVWKINVLQHCYSL